MRWRSLERRITRIHVHLKEARADGHYDRIMALTMTRDKLLEELHSKYQYQYEQAVFTNGWEGTAE